MILFYLTLGILAFAYFVRGIIELAAWEIATAFVLGKDISLKKKVRLFFRWPFVNKYKEAKKD